MACIHSISMHSILFRLVFSKYISTEYCGLTWIWAYRIFQSIQKAVDSG